MVDLSAIRWKPRRITIINKNKQQQVDRSLHLSKKAMRPTIAVIVTVTVKVAQAVARK